jgi:hypothetical protein
MEKAKKRTTKTTKTTNSFNWLSSEETKKRGSRSGAATEVIEYRGQ